MGYFWGARILQTPLNVSDFKARYSETLHRVKFVFIGKTDEKTPSYTIAQHKRAQYVRRESHSEAILRGCHYIFNSALIEALVFFCRNKQTYYYLFQSSTSHRQFGLF